MGNNVVEWIKSVFVGEEEDETENEPMIIDGDEKEEKERSSGKNAGGSGNSRYPRRRSGFFQHRDK